jgi:hypothetical protein
MEQPPLHWSEKARMYPPQPGAGPSGPSPSGGKGAPKRPADRPPKQRSSRKGLLAVLLVILVLAAAAAVLLLWYIPSRDAGQQESDLAVSTSTTVTTVRTGDTVTTTQASDTTDATTTTVLGGPVASAEDIDAVVMLSNAIIVIDSAFQSTNTFEPSVMTPAALKKFEPSMTFVVRDTLQDAATAPTGTVEASTVDFFGTPTDYALGTTSKSGTTFGVIVADTETGPTTTYYVNGQVEDWTKLLASGVIRSLLLHMG